MSVAVDKSAHLFVQSVSSYAMMISIYKNQCLL
jgi:hypothetical protein